MTAVRICLDSTARVGLEAAFDYNRPVPIKTLLSELGETRAWVLELGAAGFCLLLGAALMPSLIFFAGSLILGRYDGATLGHTYRSIFSGAGNGSIASWIVILGPYGLYLLFRGLRAWWRAGVYRA
jgi:hypothetical protein